MKKEKAFHIHRSLLQSFLFLSMQLLQPLKCDMITFSIYLLGCLPWVCLSKEKNFSARIQFLLVVMLQIMSDIISIHYPCRPINHNQECFYVRCIQMHEIAFNILWKIIINNTERIYFSHYHQENDAIKWSRAAFELILFYSTDRQTDSQPGKRTHKRNARCCVTFARNALRSRAHTHSHMVSQFISTVSRK